MLLFFFPAHGETWVKAVVATVSVTATWKHVGVVVIVTVVASVLEKKLHPVCVCRYMQIEALQSWPKKFVLGCVIPPAGAAARSRNLGPTFLDNSVYKELPICQI